MSNIRIYHNPRCSKSRQTLEIIRSEGIEPQVILYLEEALSHHEIADALRKLDMKPQDVMRKTEPEFKEYFSSLSELSDTQMIDLMRTYPKVIERPIIVTETAAVIGRPPERVRDIL